MELNVVYNEDCLVGMQRIPDKSIDMILCDLPYGTTACKWDVIIPFEPLWKQYQRIIKDNGAIVLTASQPFTSALVMSNPQMFKYEWIWKKQKPTNFYQVKWQPLKDHENTLVFSKGKPMYNAQGTKQVNIKSGRKNKSSNLYSVYNGGDYIQTIGNYPRSVQFFATEGDINRLHPTQKPVALFEYLIKTYTNEGETVLDNCAGSGTTAIACMNTNRNYILMEKEEKYYDIIQERIANYKPLPKVIQMNGASQPEIHKEKMPTQQKQQMLLNL